jgi:hypothetical protein
VGPPQAWRERLLVLSGSDIATTRTARWISKKINSSRIHGMFCKKLVLLKRLRASKSFALSAGY